MQFSLADQRLATAKSPWAGSFPWNSPHHRFPALFRLRASRGESRRRMLHLDLRRRRFGEPFFPEAPERCGALRFNFSRTSEAQIDRGLEILAGLV